MRLGTLRVPRGDTPGTREEEGAGRGGPSAGLGGARSSVGSVAARGCRPGRAAGRPPRSPSRRQGTTSGRARQAERRRRRGQPGERRSFGGAVLEAEQEGTGGTAASPGAEGGGGVFLGFPLGVSSLPPPQAPAEDTCQHVPAVVVSSHVIAPPPGLGHPPSGPHYPQAQPPRLTCGPSRVPLLDWWVSSGSEHTGPAPRRRHSSARSYPGCSSLGLAPPRAWEPWSPLAHCPWAQLRADRRLGPSP